MTQSDTSLSENDTSEQRYEKLGLTLRPVPSAVGDYEPWIKVGSMIHTSGQLPWIDGDLKFTDKLGSDLTTDEGNHAFRLPALNGIAQLKSAVGELSRIKRIVRVSSGRTKHLFCSVRGLLRRVYPSEIESVISAVWMIDQRLDRPRSFRTN